MKIYCAKGDSSLPTYLLIWTSTILFLQFKIQHVSAWDNAEFEMFDLVEEVGKNFYEVLEVLPDASDKEIRQAYRKLSVKLHPDKNPAEDAAVKFRQLVGIYEVLKNKELKESYNRVLVEGLPNWRQPIYYFRRARKLALWQVFSGLLFFVSLGQYLAGWAGYFEKRLSMKEAIEARLRKSQRTKRAQKDGPSAQELEAEFEKYLPKPSLWNLAPFQIYRGIKYLIFTLPKDIVTYREQLKLEKEEQERLAAIEQERLEKERLKAEEPKKPRKRKTFKAPEKSEKDENDGTQPIWNAETSSTQSDQTPAKRIVVSGGLWTDDDLTELAKLCSKFPGGTPQRWETIADVLCRPVPEVTFMAKKILEKLASKPAEPEQVVPQVKVKVKTKGGKADSIAAVDTRTIENWSTDEQKALEYALQCYPKGSLDRWEKIAHMVPARSKEECMQRFKYVADLVKKKKKAETDSKSESTEQQVEEEDKGDFGSQEKVESATSQVPSKVESKEVEHEAPPLVPVLVTSAVQNLQLTVGQDAPTTATTTVTTDDTTAVSPVIPAKFKQEKQLPQQQLDSPPTVIDHVAAELQSLVDESVNEDNVRKTPVHRSSSKSSEEDALVVIRRGSKECSVERKNSSSSNNSENDWCVLEDIENTNNN